MIDCKVCIEQLDDEGEWRTYEKWIEQRERERGVVLEKDPGNEVMLTNMCVYD